MSVTGDRLRELREEANLTQEELSKKVDIKRATYAKYETGVNPVPVVLIIKFADLFSSLLNRIVTTDYILGRSPLKHMKESYRIDSEVMWIAEEKSSHHDTGRTDDPTPPQAKKEEPSHEEYVLDVKTLADAAIRIANLFNEDLIDEEEYLRLNALAVKKFPLNPTKGSPRAAHLEVDMPGTGVFEKGE